MNRRIWAATGAVIAAAGMAASIEGPAAWSAADAPVALPFVFTRASQVPDLPAPRRLSDPREPYQLAVHVNVRASSDNRYVVYLATRHFSWDAADKDVWLDTKTSNLRYLKPSRFIWGISDDGRYILEQQQKKAAEPHYYSPSVAENPVVVRDVRTEETTTVPIPGDTGIDGLTTAEGAYSADGSRVVMWLVGDDPDKQGWDDVLYVWDRDTRVVRIGRTPRDAWSGDELSGAVAISGDGQRVAYPTACPAGPASVYGSCLTIWEPDTDAYTYVPDPDPVGNPDTIINQVDVSKNGAYVAWSSWLPDGDRPRDGGTWKVRSWRVGDAAPSLVFKDGQGGPGSPPRMISVSDHGRVMFSRRVHHGTHTLLMAAAWDHAQPLRPVAQGRACSSAVSGISQDGRSLLLGITEWYGKPGHMRLGRALYWQPIRKPTGPPIWGFRPPYDCNHPPG